MHATHACIVVPAKRKMISRYRGGPPGSGASPQGGQRAKTGRSLMAKWIAVAVVLIVLAAGLGWWNWRNSAMREMERSEKAVASSKSWHYQSLHHFPASPP